VDAGVKKRGGGGVGLKHESPVPAQAIEEVARACGLPTLLLCSTDDPDVKATWRAMGFLFTSQEVGASPRHQLGSLRLLRSCSLRGLRVLKHTGRRVSLAPEEWSLCGRLSPTPCAHALHACMLQSTCVSAQCRWSQCFASSPAQDLHALGVREGDLLHMDNTVQMHKPVPPRRAWRSVVLTHQAWRQRLYWLPTAETGVRERLAAAAAARKPAKRPAKKAVAKSGVKRANGGAHAR
jgi:hypothetical protein